MEDRMFDRWARAIGDAWWGRRRLITGLGGEDATALLRSLATTPSRRGVARALAGFTLAGVLSPLFGFAETDAKNKRKKKRRRKTRRKKKPQHFCVGRNLCTGDRSGCGLNTAGSGCFCLVTAEAGTPFCADAWTLTLDCDACSQGEACVALGGDCEAGMACATPCPNPQ
jgi:hypothetical protein